MGADLPPLFWLIPSLRHSHPLSIENRLHLSHNVSAMNFDCDLACPHSPATFC